MATTLSAGLAARRDAADPVREWRSGGWPSIDFANRLLLIAFREQGLSTSPGFTPPDVRARARGMSNRSNREMMASDT